MKRFLFPAVLLASVCLLAACTTDDPAMRAGIHQPLDRHPKSIWQSAKEFPRDFGRTVVHAADGETTPTNESW